MNYKDIKNFDERFNEMRPHEGDSSRLIISVGLLCEEVQELRQYIELNLKCEDVWKL